MDDLNPIAAKDAQEIAEAQRLKYGPRIEKLVQMGASRELAEYLVSLDNKDRQTRTGADHELVTARGTLWPGFSAMR